MGGIVDGKEAAPLRPVPGFPSVNQALIKTPAPKGYVTGQAYSVTLIATMSKSAFTLPAI